MRQVMKKCSSCGNGPKVWLRYTPEMKWITQSEQPKHSELGPDGTYCCSLVCNRGALGVLCMFCEREKLMRKVHSQLSLQF